MKIKGILLATLSVLGISGAFAQGVEYDDMYFTAADRAKLKAQQPTEVAYNTPKSRQLDLNEENENANPTDSYSARNVNPEYTSREHTQTAQVDDEDYFVNNYQYNRTQLSSWNNNFNQWYGNPWYRSNYYGSGISSWNSPYYGYDSWNSPWYDPYWDRSGWSSSFSFHYGRAWNYGWGGQYNYWNRPYYGFDPYYSGYGSGFGGGWYSGGYWNNYMNPGTIVIVNNGENGRVSYGKRPTRGTTIVSDHNNVRTRSSVNNAVRGDNSGGRISTPNRKQEEYYNRYNRTTRTPSTSTYGSRENTQNNRSSSWNDNNSRYDNNRTSTPSYSPSRSSGSDAGTRTNSSSGSGGRRGRD